MLMEMGWTGVKSESSEMQLEDNEHVSDVSNCTWRSRMADPRFVCESNFGRSPVTSTLTHKYSRIRNGCENGQNYKRR